MRFFFIQDFQHWLLSLFLGLVLAILVYLGFTAYADSRERAGERGEEEFNYPDGIRGKNFPTPLFIIFLYIGFFIWAVLYVIFIGLRGPI